MQFGWSLLLCTAWSYTNASICAPNGSGCSLFAMVIDIQHHFVSNNYKNDQMKNIYHSYIVQHADTLFSIHFSSFALFLCHTSIHLATFDPIHTQSLTLLLCNVVITLIKCPHAIHWSEPSRAGTTRYFMNVILFSTHSHSTRHHTLTLAACSLQTKWKF